MKRILFAVLVLVLVASLAWGWMGGVIGGGVMSTSAPTLTARTIGTDGTTLTLTGSESLSVGTGGNGGFDVDCATAGQNITATYSSGAPGTNLVYTLGTTVNSGDTCDLDYTQPGDGIEATTGGADLASITSAAVTNNSTQGCTTALWTNSGVGTTDLDINDATAYAYAGQIIQDTTTRTICKVKTWISYKAGDISGKTFRAYFAPLGAGQAITSASAVEADATVTGSNSWNPATNSVGTEIEWTFTGGYTLTANEDYAFYVTMDGVADAANYAELEISTDTNIPGGTQASWNSSYTLNTSGGADLKVVFYE